MPLHTCSTTPVKKCEICHGDHFSQVGIKDREGRGLRTVICQDCGLVFSDPRPISQEIDDFYRETYRVVYKQAWQPRLKHTYRAGKVAQERLEYLMPLLAPDRAICDFGSGGGELVFILRELGYDASGIEPNTGYAEYSRDILGIPVQIGGFASARVEQGSLDLVTLFHVAEHLEHPVHALRTIAGWLREGGRLLVEVPNVESRCIWPSSRFHQAHLYNFNTATLAQAGRCAGLRVVDSFASSDGGNIMCIFEKPEIWGEVEPAPLPGNAAHVLEVLRRHTVLSHSLTLHPYQRPVQKLRRRREEAVAVRNATDGKTLLQTIAREIRAKGMRAAHSVPESMFSSDDGGLAGV